MGFDDITVLDANVQTAGMRLVDRIDKLTARYDSAQSDEERRSIIFEMARLSVKTSLLSVAHTVASRQLIGNATKP